MKLDGGSVWSKGREDASDTTKIKGVVYDIQDMYNCESPTFS